MDKVFVKPTAEGLKVPLPRDLQVNGRVYLKAEGEELSDCTWWRRREREGDVAINAVKAAPTAKEARVASKASE